MTMDVDALVIGGGIAGLQSALDLADQGFQVLLVERQPSIGGTMIALSKVFPTLDCASCITTPKMAAVAHHENITMFTYTEVESVRKEGDKFKVLVTRKPRYVDESKCTGCRVCEFSCPVDLPHEFEGNLGARKAIYVPFGTAIPQKAVLDLEHCILCGKCEKVCPAQAVDFLQEPEQVTVTARAIILATGFNLTPMGAKKEYHAEEYPNVINALQMERLLAPNGPYGRVLRPSDGKIPNNIAYIQCAGSRDKSLGVPYCSRVCCMYAIKQAMLLSGALPLADITIYYMDIRAFGKGYEQFFQTARAMGINFVKGKVARIEQMENGDLKLRVELMDETGAVSEPIHDLVVLSLGMVPGCDLQQIIPVETDQYGFVKSPQPKIDPTLTSLEGVFAAGTAISPKDIVDTIIEGSAAAAKAAVYLGAPAAVGGNGTGLKPRIEAAKLASEAA
ncbi:MAG TPA: CoB--CoM heterodisulfide reductase iron-sulfur subunit A family protein [Caldilineae bacterium]|nr:CoB--CoM heterodisulfide reductase iron-sulfur subunit A family protein [Caldilineae bacterium]